MTSLLAARREFMMNVLLDVRELGYLPSQVPEQPRHLLVIVGCCRPFADLLRTIRGPPD